MSGIVATPFRAVLGAALLLALSACGPMDDSVADPMSDDGSSTRAGSWDVAGVEAKLRALHLEPVRAATPVNQAFMRVPGTRIDIGSSEVQVYIYADHNARAHDTNVLNPHHVAPPHTMISWRLPPTLIVSDNMAGILLTDQGTLRDHVRASLTTPPH